MRTSYTLAITPNLSAVYNHTGANTFRMHRANLYLVTDMPINVQSEIAKFQILEDFHHFLWRNESILQRNSKNVVWD